MQTGDFESIKPFDPPSTSFSDIFGLEDVKRTLRERVIEPWRQCAAMNSSSLLFVGLPGNGKTEFAKAVAHESGAACYAAELWFHGRYAGEREQYYRNLYDAARSNARAVVFIKDIDNWFGQIQTGAEYGARRQAEYGEFRRQLELASRDEPVRALTIATSNRPWEIEPDILRSFSLIIEIPRPDYARRLAMVRHRFHTVPIDFDCESVAERTDGFTAADVIKLCDRAAQNAIHRIKDLLEASLPSVTNEDLLSAFDYIQSHLVETNTERYDKWKSECNIAI